MKRLLFVIGLVFVFGCSANNDADVRERILDLGFVESERYDLVKTVIYKQFDEDTEFRATTVLDTVGFSVHVPIEKLNDAEHLMKAIEKSEKFLASFLGDPQALSNLYQEENRSQSEFDDRQKYEVIVGPWSVRADRIHSFDDVSTKNSQLVASFYLEPKEMRGKKRSVLDLP